MSTKQNLNGGKPERLTINNQTFFNEQAEEIYNDLLHLANFLDQQKPRLDLRETMCNRFIAKHGIEKLKPTFIEASYDEIKVKL